MPSKKITQLKDSYQNGPDRIGRDLVQPCLEECKLYRRGTAFFSSSALKSYASSIDHILKDNVKIEILCSPVVSDKALIDILQRNSTDAKRKETIQKLSDGIVLTAIGFGINPDRMDYRSKLLSYLIANGQIEIRFAILTNYKIPYEEESSEERNNERNLYHVKKGYFLFPDESIVAFDGSFNESDSALNHNIESTQVFHSWNEHDKSRVQSLIKSIDDDWFKRNPYIEVLELSSEALTKIRESAPHARPRAPTKDLPVTITEPLNGPNLDGPILRNYQKEALIHWKDNSYQGILAMATGSGKTVTAIEAITEFKKEYKDGFVVIVVPKINLATQWMGELKSFGQRSIGAFTEQEWYTRLNNLVFKASISKGSQDLPCVVVVMVTFKDEKFQTLLKNISESGSQNNLIIVDECHHFNNADAIKKLPESFNYRLGLSATPFNQYEEEPEAQYLLNYFKNVVFEYSLADAIKNKNLTPYNYFIIEANLDEEETDAYEELDAKISKLVAIKLSTASSNGGESLNTLYARKNRLLGSVKDKLIKLDDLLESEGKKKFVLAYCGSSKEEEDEGYRKRHIDRVSKIFFNRGWAVGKITSDESIKEREKTIEDLTNRFQDVIVSIRVLDEGIDIPCCQTAFILSSSKSNREFIQRRGRVLRRSPGKDHADIYDFVITGGFRNSKSIEKLVVEEFYRVNEFAKLAINKSFIFEKYERYLSKYEQ